MPKVSSDIEPALRPYIWLGVQDLVPVTHEEAVGACPFCGRERKFYVSLSGGLWQCKVCMTGSQRGGGNAYTFIRALWDASADSTTDADYRELAADRRLQPETLAAWGVRRSCLSGDWLIPGFTADGRLVQLYSRRHLYINGKWCWTQLPTPGLAPEGSETLRHGLHMPLDQLGRSGDVDTAYVCEGAWDGMALWETLCALKYDEDSPTSYSATGSYSASLAATSAVYAVPGAGIFAETWLPLLAGKRVVLMYDSDHPRLNNGKRTLGAGIGGMRLAASAMSRATTPPREVYYLHWGDDGYNPSLPSGYDVRDVLCGKGDDELLEPASRGELLAWLRDSFQPIPSEWVSGMSGGKPGVAKLELLPCDSWDTMIEAWKEAMFWTEGADRTLSVMLAVVISTETIDDLLWVMVTGVASCGKSTLCEAVDVDKEHIVSVSSFKGFYSGMKSDKHGVEDHSLLHELRNKTFIVKDGDTLLKAPNRDQIMSQLRDLYDRVARVRYNNGIKRTYDNLRMTFLLCGTGSMYTLDASERGARFLVCSMMRKIDANMERAVNMKVVARAFKNVTILANGAATSQDSPELILAKRLTGGYVNYLRKNAERLLGGVRIASHLHHTIVVLGEFTAFMRARPSDEQDEVAEREFSSRLVVQMAQLTTCIAAAMGKTEADDEVVRRVRQVALDTSEGRTLNIARLLYAAENIGGLDGLTVAVRVGESSEKTMELLGYLRKIEAVGVYGVEKRWRLTPRLRELWSEVMSNAID